MAGKASRENGKLGGRPPSEATIRTQKAREFISEQLEASLPPIVAKAITQAMEGNNEARMWLSDRGWGKATQFLDIEHNLPASLAEILAHGITNETGDTDVPEES